MRTTPTHLQHHSRTDPQHPVHPRAAVNEFEPSRTAVGTFAAGQSARGEYHIAAEAAVGSYACGLAADEQPRRV